MAVHRDRVLADIDDVTAQFRQGYLRTVHELFGIELTVDQCKNLYDIDKTLELDNWQRSQLWKKINSPGWCFDLEPMPGAIYTISELAKRYEVMFVTKPLKTSPTWYSDRRKWLKKYFGADLADNLHGASKKYAVDGNWLIEDRVDHAELWTADRQEHSKRRFEAILFAWPYNEHTPQRFVRLPDWNAIGNYLSR